MNSVQLFILNNQGGTKMKWTNILKRSKAHTSRKIRRGRSQHQRFDRSTRSTPISGHTPDVPYLESKKDKPNIDMEAELAEQTKKDLIVVLTEKVQAMSKEDIIDLLVRTQGTLEE